MNIFSKPLHTASIFSNLYGELPEGVNRKTGSSTDPAVASKVTGLEQIRNLDQVALISSLDKRYTCIRSQSPV